MSQVEGVLLIRPVLENDKWKYVYSRKKIRQNTRGKKKKIPNRQAGVR